jgi:hypothetical protein
MEHNIVLNVDTMINHKYHEYSLNIEWRLCRIRRTIIQCSIRVSLGQPDARFNIGWKWYQIRRTPTQYSLGVGTG